MNGQVYSITPEQARDFMNIDLHSWIEASRPLLTGIYKDKCECVFGAIPTALLSDKAYLWLWTPQTITGYVVARHAKIVVPKLLQLYSILICHCENDRSAHWLTSLGARKTGPNFYAFGALDG